MQEYVAEFQGRRNAVTDELLSEFMRPRKLEWAGNPNPKPKEKTQKDLPERPAKPKGDKDVKCAKEPQEKK